MSEEKPAGAQDMVAMPPAKFLETGAFLMAELTSTVTALHSHSLMNGVDMPLSEVAWRAGAWSGLALTRARDGAVPARVPTGAMRVLAMKEGESDAHDVAFSAWSKRWSGLNASREQLYEAFSEAWVAGAADARKKRSRT